MINPNISKDIVHSNIVTTLGKNSTIKFDFIYPREATDKLFEIILNILIRQK